MCDFLFNAEIPKISIHPHSTIQLLVNCALSHGAAGSVQGTTDVVPDCNTAAATDYSQKGPKRSSIFVYNDVVG